KETLKRVVNAPSFAARYDEMRREILENTDVQQFLSDHADELNKDIVDRSLGKLYEFTTASHRCDKCNSLTECSNIMNGFEPKLVLKRNLIDIDYVKCPTRLVEEDR